MGILDLFFPKYCVSCRKVGTYLCPPCFSRVSFINSSVCGVCSKSSFDGFTHKYCRKKYTIDGIFASVVYTPTLRKLIASFKYKPYVTDLSELLTTLFFEGLIQNEFFYSTLTKESFFVPIPLHRTKERMRGYNHASILSLKLSKHFDLVNKDLLVRVRKTTSQFGLKREERVENIEGAFDIRRNISFPPVVFLVDDIVTSGVTFLEAGKVLKRNGVEKVYGLALAHGR